MMMNRTHRLIAFLLSTLLLNGAVSWASDNSPEDGLEKLRILKNVGDQIIKKTPDRYYEEPYLGNNCHKNKKGKYRSVYVFGENECEFKKAVSDTDPYLIENTRNKKERSIFEPQ